MVEAAPPPDPTPPTKIPSTHHYNIAWPQRFLEGLQQDMKDIDAAPPDVRAMRRTFTVERILSGACLPACMRH